MCNSRTNPSDQLIYVLYINALNRGHKDIFHKAGKMKASRWEPVDDEPSAHKSRWENEDEDDVPKSKWEREDDDEKEDKLSKESSENSKWQRVSDSPRDR